MKPGYTAWFLWTGKDYANTINIMYCFKKDGVLQYSLDDDIPDFPDEDDNEEMEVETAGGEPLHEDMYNADGGKFQRLQCEEGNAMIVA